MGIISRLLATPKSIEQTLNAAVATGDKLFFTKEEKAEMNERMRDWYLKYLEATQPMNLARRFLALIVAGMWAFLLSCGTALTWLSHTETAEAIFKIMSDHVNLPFTGIMAFYFATHLVRNSGK